MMQLVFTNITSQDEVIDMNSKFNFEIAELLIEKNVN